MKGKTMKASNKTNRKTKKKPKKRIAGFDMGTTNCAVFILDDDGNPQIVTNDFGDNTTPSALYYDKKKILIGKAATRMAYRDPLRFIAYWKPIIGERDNEGNPAVTRHDQDSGTDQTAVVHHTHLAQAIKEQCEKRLGDEIEFAVVTVPAYFNDVQREDTKFAMEQAGFKVLKVADEPNAAATAYGFEKGEDQVLMVYDLGGGTFDCTIVEIKGGVIRVLEKSGNPRLGGDDYSVKIRENIIAEFKKKHGFEPDPSDDAKPCQELSEKSEDAKKDLSISDSTLIHWGCRGCDIELELSRQEFNNMIRPKVEETLTHVKDALNKANLEPSDIDTVICIGGATRVPMVQDLLEDFMGQKPLADIDPDQAVAKGAAIIGWEMSQRPDSDKEVQKIGKLLPPAPFKTEDITAYPLSIALVQPDKVTKYNHVMIPAGSSIPVDKTDCFAPVADYQDVIRVSVTQQEQDSSYSEDQEIAFFDLPLKPPMTIAEGGMRCEVTYTINESSIVKVVAKDTISGKIISGDAKTKVAMNKQRIKAEQKAIKRKVR